MGPTSNVADVTQIDAATLSGFVNAARGDEIGARDGQPTGVVVVLLHDFGLALVPVTHCTRPTFPRLG